MPTTPTNQTTWTTREITTLWLLFTAVFLLVFKLAWAGDLMPWIMVVSPLWVPDVVGIAAGIAYSIVVIIESIVKAARR